MQSQGVHWQSNEFRCSRSRENACEGAVLKGSEAEKGAQTQDLSPRAPRYPQKRQPVGDFSAPKLDSLPTRSQTVHRNSIHCQREPRKCPRDRFSGREVDALQWKAERPAGSTPCPAARRYRCWERLRPSRGQNRRQRRCAPVSRPCGQRACVRNARSCPHAAPGRPGPP